MHIAIYGKNFINTGKSPRRALLIRGYPRYIHPYTTKAEVKKDNF